jgi:hypothetical protein
VELQLLVWWRSKSSSMCITKSVQYNSQSDLIWLGSAHVDHVDNIGNNQKNQHIPLVSFHEHLLEIYILFSWGTMLFNLWRNYLCNEFCMFMSFIFYLSILLTCLYGHMTKWPRLRKIGLPSWTKWVAPCDACMSIYVLSGHPNEQNQTQNMFDLGGRVGADTSWL